MYNWWRTTTLLTAFMGAGLIGLSIGFMIGFVLFAMGY